MTDRYDYIMRSGDEARIASILSDALVDDLTGRAVRIAVRRRSDGVTLATLDASPGELANEYGWTGTLSLAPDVYAVEFVLPLRDADTVEADTIAAWVTLDANAANEWLLATPETDGFEFELVLGEDVYGPFTFLTETFAALVAGDGIDHQFDALVETLGLAEPVNANATPGRFPTLPEPWLSDYIYVFTWPNGQRPADFAVRVTSPTQTFPNDAPHVLRVTDPSIEPLDLLRGRIETDLDDSQLAELLDVARRDVARVAGPEPDVDGFVEDLFDSLAVRTDALILRQAPESSGVDDLVVYERTRGSSEETTLDVADYRLDGRLLFRATGRSWNTWDATIRVRYKPSKGDAVRRRSVVVELAALDALHDPANESSSYGDVRLGKLDYQAQRAKLLRSIGSLV